MMKRLLKSGLALQLGGTSHTAQGPSRLFNLGSLYSEAPSSKFLCGYSYQKLTFLVSMKLISLTIETYDIVN